MISLPCTSCKKTLEIDDAFAGGVCRCQFCGTIQTVPASLKRGARPGGPPPATSSAGPKTLYTKTASPKGRPAAESPTSETSIEPPKMSRAARPTAAASEGGANRRRTWMIGSAIGVGAAVLIGVIAWLAS